MYISTHNMKPSALFSSLSLCLFLFLSLPPPSLATRCNPNDKEALLQIKKSLNNPTHLAAWKPNTNCCNWNGIICNPTTNRVATLQLDSGNLSGQIPLAVGNLPFLENLFVLNLSNLTGHIPSSVAKLSHLTFLAISHTSISGNIPSFLSQLKNLTYINLSYNQLTGSIPSSLSQLTQLTAIDLGGNKLTGKIPASFGEFTGAVPDLYLSQNKLSGSIPKTMGYLNYSAIDLANNMLEGEVTPLFGKNKTLRFVYLGSNKFRFDMSKVELPATLFLLDLSHNGITGSLPASLASPNLMSLNVSYNRLCGQIPAGGNLQVFEPSAYLPNRCLCGAPLPACK
ncbi:hypothetical protein RJ640_010702 [Escallonia rubra]|uniref:Leucine-rich repeat-containing N-terminal plant-type domain-containing protein n=1 Tax=Escallonia rubra TaxID=112253 RepID=A0AA88RIY1_9ASTE|nr:hypothetical protein RJ640_010702 [Escallonia rubra]